MNASQTQNDAFVVEVARSASERGWTLAGHETAGEIRLRFLAGERGLELWIAPKDGGQAFRQTSRFRIGYRNGTLEGIGHGLIEEVVRLVVLHEGGLSMGQPQGGPEREELVSHGEELELRVTLRCNEKCPFCNTDDNSENVLPEAALIPGILAALPGRGVRQVVFTGGEPTLMPQLPCWIRLARDAGLQVLLQTNGIIPSRDSFWKSFEPFGGADAYPYALFMSFHTLRPERLPGITGCGGTFDDKIRAIELALERGILVTLNCVISTLNLDEVPDFPRFLAERFDGAVGLRYSVVAPTGLTRVRQDLLPSLRALKPVLEQALSESRRLGLEVRVPDACGVPFCVAPDYRQDFEALAKTAPPTQNEPDRVKPPRCRSCILNDRCRGFWAAYPEVHGDEGFGPILE
jgi:MoaA/NifB/PqqE/SkfB family radical SAM enzyme